MALLQGIDVSRYQRVTSWHAVHDAGYRFAIAKATERNDYVSPAFASAYRGARGAHIIAGSYHFARPSDSSATAQARWYVDHLKQVGFRSGYDLPPALDIEDAGGKSRSALTGWCLDFVHEVDTRLGLTEPWLRCGVYCNRDFRDNRMDGARVLAGRWLWWASWPSGQTRPTRDSQMPSGAAVWQWTANGTVPGISGNTDLNVARDTDLRALAPLYYEEKDMPVFRHYGLRDAQAIPPVTSAGETQPRAILFDTDWADPSPGAHGEGGSSYVRHARAGWTLHELAGVRVDGLKTGDNFQVQLIRMHPTKDEIVWSQVLHEARALGGGGEYFSTQRTLYSAKGERVRWRFLYFGHEKDVRISKADWVITEY